MIENDKNKLHQHQFINHNFMKNFKGKMNSISSKEALKKINNNQISTELLKQTYGVE